MTARDVQTDLTLLLTLDADSGRENKNNLLHA